MPWTHSARRRPVLGLLLALSACGGTTGSDRPETEPVLLLDAPPNGVHAGLYLTAARGFDGAEGVSLRLRSPGRRPDPVRRLETGRADLAVLSIHELGRARERGAEVVGVMALVQQPLTAVYARGSIRSPRDLEGARAGVTDRPADAALLRAVVEGGGGDPARVRRTRVGARGLRALATGRVDAVTGYESVEGAALGARGAGTRVFAVEDFGAPAYPELVLAVTRDTLTDRPDEVQAVIRGLQRGTGEAQRDPESAISAMLEEEPRLDRATLAAQLDAVSPAFSAGSPVYGVLDPGRLRAWAAWSERAGILRRRPDPGRAFDTTLVPPVQNP